MSGFMMNGMFSFGPLELNQATAGEGFVPTKVCWNLMETVGFLVRFAYLIRVSPSSKLINTPGNGSNSSRCAISSEINIAPLICTSDYNMAGSLKHYFSCDYFPVITISYFLFI